MISGIISEIAKILSQSELSNSTLSVRKNDFWGYERQDDNVFAKASTLFILQQYATHFKEKEKAIFEKIEEIILAKYPLYENKDGRKTYNFYRTKPTAHFPNGKFMGRMDHFRLPDDIDDTALVYLTSKFSKEDIIWLKNHCYDHADERNGEKIYNTWFGKNMPKEQDVCAMLNLLYLFHLHNLATEEIDKISRQFIAKSIDLIEKNPFQVARHYGNSALIVYHLGRFMERFQTEELDFLKPKLIDLSKKLVLSEKVFLNKLLLETVLLKFGEKREKLLIPGNFDNNFYSFIGAPFAPFPKARWISAKPWTQIFWKSNIHELALVLEYEILNS